MARLATIGYQGATLAQVVARLRAAGVEEVADVRAVAASRRAGFSKTLLGASFAEAGIDYVHFRALGTPKPGRDAARKGRTQEMRAIFAAHMAGAEAQAALAALKARIGARRLALLCFCGDAATCHRRALVEMLGVEADDL